MDSCSKSSEYLRLIKSSETEGDDILELEEDFNKLSVEDISGLDDDEKKCFWCNLYNGLVRKEMKFHGNYPSNTPQKIRFFYRTHLQRKRESAPRLDLGDESRPNNLPKPLIDGSSKQKCEEIAHLNSCVPTRT